jgi:hypothetical protein
MYKKILTTLVVAGLIGSHSFAANIATENSVPVPARPAVDMGEGCAISVEDIFRGHLASGMALNASYWTDKPPIKTTIGNFTVNFVCTHVNISSIEQLARRHGGTYDTAKKRWVAYYEGSDRELLSPVTRFYPLRAVNSTGFARTTDEVLGDPRQRVRFFSYCLFHDTQAICGDGQVMRLSEPKGDLLPYVLDILRTVDFVNPATVKPAGPASAASTTD